VSEEVLNVLLTGERMQANATGAVDTAAPTTDRTIRSRTVEGPVRIAVIGCGAMTRENLLPVLAGHERIRVVSLVDVNEVTARALAEAYGVPTVLTDVTKLDPRQLDAAVIATPPAFHAPQTIELARRGLHVFVEKPMAIDAAEGERMLQATDEAGVTLTVGLYRRLLPSTRLLRGMLESGIMGAPIAVDIEEGGEYGWALATLANLTTGLGAGGVLIDIGSHLLDVLQFLLPGSMHLLSYGDNAAGGVETDALMKLSIVSGGREIPCRLELSRTRRLRNSIRVECERGVLELARGEFADVQVRFHDVVVRDALRGIRSTSLTARWGDEQPPIGYQVFRAEIDDWLDAITYGSESVLSGRSVLATVRLIEDAYRTKGRLAEPWSDEGVARSQPRLKRGGRTGRRRVLITGASGFIGCRTAEILSIREDCDVRAIVRNPSHAARLARLRVEMVPGDICSDADVTRAMEGCDAVVHCAVGTSWQPAETVRTTVVGTRTVADAARRAGVERFVHISSIAVHGRVASATLDELAPLVDPGEEGYAGEKRRAEDEVQKLVAQGLRAVILRPARVYGPFGKTFTTRPLQHIARGTLTLSGPYNGPSSMVYVDNVVEAILCALDSEDTAIGQAFAISERDQLSWREFYEVFAEALGTRLLFKDASLDSTESPRAPGLLARWRSGLGDVMMSPELRAFARKCIQTDPVGVIPRKLWEDVPALRRRLQSALGMTEAMVYRPETPSEESPMVFRTESALVLTDKAETVLGYRPAVSRARAMELTLKWAQHSRLA
jgi:predicted dehydrogenase/nucleoside-diphosphate-sugar epimerase